jgi:heme/copper-type cytochrome/quinol oxidase subunit 3
MTDAVAGLSDLRVARTSGAGVATWGMLLFIVNEATLFMSLIGSYAFLGVSNTSWPPSGVAKPSLSLPLIMTLALLSSSVVLAVADRSRKRGNRRRYRAGVVGTALLGVTFLALQGKEYADKLMTLRPSQNSYGSLFYTITGLHGAHVAFGLLFLMWALARDAKDATGTSIVGLRNASMYWHFVDGVWLAILTTLYLSPRFT